MIDVGPADLIAVENRSHNLFALFQVRKKFFVLPAYTVRIKPGWIT